MSSSSVVTPPSKRSFDELYLLTKKIGSGVQGTVYLGKRLSDNDLVAVKVVPKKNWTRATAELKVLKEVNHQNVVRFFDFFDAQEVMYIVMEYCGGGDVCERIISSKKPFSEQVACKIMKEILQGLYHLHARDILHLDIKPDNLLFSTEAEDSLIKLADFGWGKIMRHGEGPMRRLAGTLSYASPQVVSEQEYGKDADMWSVGVTLFVILSGRVLYGSNNERIIKRKILHLLQPESEEEEFPVFRGDVWSKISDQAKDLITRCLQVDPSKRITVEEALDHPWIVSSDLPGVALDGAVREMVVYTKHRKLKCLESPMISQIIYEVRKDQFASAGKVLMDIGLAEEHGLSSAQVQDMRHGNGIQRVYAGILTNNEDTMTETASMIMNLAMDPQMAAVISETGGIRHLVKVISETSAGACRFSLMALYYLCQHHLYALKFMEEGGVRALIDLSSNVESSDGLRLLASGVLAELVLVSFQVRDAVVAEGGIPVLILFASQADATVGFRECLMALAKISEDRTNCHRMWAENLCALCSSEDSASRRAGTRICADISFCDDLACTNMVQEGMPEHFAAVLAHEEDHVVILNILNTLGTFAKIEESRQRILQTGVLAAVERFKEKGPCSDLALDFTCRWLLQVLGEEGGDSSDGKLVSGCNFSPLLHCLTDEVAFRNDAPVTQFLVYMGFASRGKYYFEIRLDNVEQIRIGVAGVESPAIDASQQSLDLGDDATSFGYEARRGRVIHNGQRKFLGRGGCKPGDVIGVALNMDDLELSFYQNGNFLKTAFGPDTLQAGEFYGPAISFGRGQQAHLNFGTVEFLFPLPENFSPFSDVFASEGSLMGASAAGIPNSESGYSLSSTE